MRAVFNQKKHVVINTDSDYYTNEYERNPAPETGRPPHRTQTLSPASYQVSPPNRTNNGREYRGIPASAASDNSTMSPVSSSGLGSDGTLPQPPVYITKRFDSKSVEKPWWAKDEKNDDLLAKKSSQMISV